MGAAGNPKMQAAHLQEDPMGRRGVGCGFKKGRRQSVNFRSNGFKKGRRQSVNFRSNVVSESN